MVSQNMSESELHLRAILGLPIEINPTAPASYCFHGKTTSIAPTFEGLEEALESAGYKNQNFRKNHLPGPKEEWV